jgi:hypothetical protein
MTESAAPRVVRGTENVRRERLRALLDQGGGSISFQAVMSLGCWVGIKYEAGFALAGTAEEGEGQERSQ